MFDPHLLEAVLTLDELRSFRRAAEALNVSQPTFTRYIQKAESTCGFAIFERQPGDIRTTPAGRELLEICRDLHHASQHFENRLEKIRTQGTGDLRIGSGPLPARTVVEPLLLQLLAARPNLKVSLEIDAHIDIVNALDRREVDVFVGELTHTPAFEGLTVRVLKRQEMVLVANPEHRIHAGGPYALKEILSYPLALPYLHRYWRQTFAAATGASVGDGSARPIPQIECDDYAVLAGIASQSDFVSGGTRENFEPYLQSGRLRTVRLAEPIYWNICAARSEAWRSPPLEDFWSLLIAN